MIIKVVQDDKWCWFASPNRHFPFEFPNRILICKGVYPTLHHLTYWGWSHPLSSLDKTLLSWILESRDLMSGLMTSQEFRSKAVRGLLLEDALGPGVGTWAELLQSNHREKLICLWLSKRFLIFCWIWAKKHVTPNCLELPSGNYEGSQAEDKNSLSKAESKNHRETEKQNCSLDSTVQESPPTSRILACEIRNVFAVMLLAGKKS